MVNRNLLALLPSESKARLVKRPQPKWLAPMLATLTDERFSRAGWLFEPKWDGERCLVFRREGNLSLFSRNRIRLDEKYPEIVAALRRQRIASFIADGEIVTFENGLTSFEKLQERMKIARPSETLLRSVPVWLYLFDLLYVDHYDIRQVPLQYRKEILSGTFEFRDSLQLTKHLERDGEAYFRRACRSGWEGIIAKNGDSAYVSRRTRDWLKFKCGQEQEFVIGGYTVPRGSRIGFGALLLGYYCGQTLSYAGKVGTGFNHDLLQHLGKRLARLQMPNPPFADDTLPRRGVHWVKPRLIAQIGFTEWTADGRLRHPRFLGLRHDKQPEEIVREA
jgi:bifunctional non-homologous end joining protein LigD